MENLDDFLNGENCKISTWVNEFDNHGFRRYSELIGKLESLQIEYSQVDFDWLKSNNNTYQFGGRNNQFHYFVYCIDWSELYGLSNSKLTIYDILITSNSRKNKVKEFRKAYEELRKLFDGMITSTEDLVKCRDVVLGKISEGLTSYQNSKGFKSKGLNEFLKMLFEKIGNVDYEISSFSIPYLTGNSQRGRFITDVYEKIIPAFEVAKKFNKEFKDSISGVTIDDFFAMHVLLRHTVEFKFKEIYSPISGNAPEILNGLKKHQKVTACANSEGFISVISKDGVFYPPNFSYKESDFLQFKSRSPRPTTDEIANNLYKKLNLLIPEFVENINPDFSPNIIYFDECLYGFEFPAYRYRLENIIELSSCYPLNSEYQLKNGISQKDIDRITNKISIPKSYEIKVENVLS